MKFKMREGRNEQRGKSVWRRGRMFKKPIKRSSESPLGGKELKKLRSDILRKFSISDAELEAFFSQKANVKCVKLAEPANATLYAVDDEPMFCDPDGKGNALFPTIYALWKCPTMLPALPIQAPVSKFVVGGADLMLPGVAIGIEGGPLQRASDLPQFEKGSGMLILCIGNPMPIAIGEMLLTRDEAMGALETGGKGKAIKMVHTYRDSLWECGSQWAPEGFLPRMAESGAWVSDISAKLAEFGGDRVGGDEAVDEAISSLGALAVGEGSGSAGGERREKDKKEKKKKKKDGKKEREGDEAEDTKAGEGEGSLEPTVVSIWEGLSPDDTVYQMLLCAIKTRITKDDLPCENSKFFKDFVGPTLHRGYKLDIKTTTHKQVSKFLAAMEKKKLLRCKKVFGQDSVIEVFSEHKDVVAYVPQEDPAAAAKKGEHLGEGEDGMFCIPGWKPNNNIVPILGGTKDDFYTEAGLQERVDAFIAKNKLAHVEGLKVDATLMHCLYCKFKEEDRPREGQAISVGRVLADLKEQMIEFHQILIDGQPVTRRGKLHKIVVVIEDRQGGRKASTNIQHLESLGLDVEIIAKQIQKKFSTGTTMVPVPGKNETRVEVQVQGNLMADIPQFLNKEYKVPLDFIELVDKTKK